MTQVLRKPIDRDAFFKMLERQEGRYELVEGRIVMMVRVTRDHVNVAANLMTLLKNLLDQTSFFVFQSDFGVATYAGVRYPDLVVERTGGRGKDLFTDAPLMTVEVLSKSSISEDFVVKAKEYKAIETLQYYLICSQDDPRVWLWTRAPDGWADAPEMIEGRDASIELPALNVRLSLAEIYKGVGGASA